MHVKGVVCPFFRYSHPNSGKGAFPLVPLPPFLNVNSPVFGSRDLSHVLSHWKSGCGHRAIWMELSEFLGHGYASCLWMIHRWLGQGRGGGGTVPGGQGRPVHVTLQQRPWFPEDRKWPARNLRHSLGRRAALCCRFCSPRVVHRATPLPPASQGPPPKLSLPQLLTPFLAQMTSCCYSIADLSSKKPKSTGFLGISAFTGIILETTRMTLTITARSKHVQTRKAHTNFFLSTG